MIQLSFSLIFGSLIFVIGLFGMMIRRNFYFLLINLMILNNGAIIVLVAASSYWKQVDGYMLVILAIITALVEACIGLALLLKLYYRRRNLNIDILSEMKG